MATTPPAATGTKPFAKGSIIWEKKGPLPVWAWALIVLGVLLAWSLWRKNKTASTANATVTGDGSPLPGDQTAPSIFIVPPASPPPVNVTVPVTTVPAGPPVGDTTTTAPPAGGAAPPSGPPAGTGSPVPSPPGVYVTVAKYTSSNPPWNSTLWGIWNHYKSTSNWQAIWNHPLNTDLRNRRGAYNKIQPGDKIFVPGAS